MFEIADKIVDRLGIGVTVLGLIGGIGFGGWGLYNRANDNSGRVGQIADNDRTSVLAHVSPNRNREGEERFLFLEYRGRGFHDAGFDGDLDRVSFYRADGNGDYQKVELTPSDPEFADHVPLYLEARDILAHGSAQTE